MAEKTMKTLKIGDDVYEIVDEAARTDIETLKQNTTVDTTLTQSGRAADAKIVGDSIDAIESEISTINSSIDAIETIVATDENSDGNVVLSYIAKGGN